MKKILSLVAGATMVLSAQAYTRILFQQTFEGMTDPTQNGWTKHDDNSGLEINSDEEGSFLKVYTKGNDRASRLYWGDDIYTDKEGKSYIEDGKYTVSFDFNYQTAANNHYNTSMTVFSGEYTITGANQSWNFTGETANWLFDLTQISDADLNATMPQFIADKDTVGKAGLSLDNWYTAEIIVDTQARTADYMVYPIVGDETPFQGSYAINDTVDIMATGLNVLIARYAAVMLIDNVTVSCESDKAVANPPVIALNRVGTEYDENTEEYSIINLPLRAYVITFPEGHTLNVKGTDGKTEAIDYIDCEGVYSYETTTSGTLEAWTTLDGATSDYVTIDVDCTPCKLPKAEATISNVTAGFGKEYTLSANNSEVPLMPTIYLAYEFTGKDGVKLSDKNLSSGAKVTLPGEGELVVTTSALGYAENTMSIENNIEYKLNKDYDFARMSEDEILAMGFAKIDDLCSSQTSGESNWTGRKRLFYYDSATEVTDEVTGEKSYTAVYPFGFVEGNEAACIHRYQIAEEALAEKASTIIPGVTFWSTKSPLQWAQHLGMMATTTTANNQPVQFAGLNITDFLVVNTIDNYGSDSNHPVVATADEYYAQLAGTNYVFSGRAAVPEGETPDINAEYTYTYNLYRIQTVLTRATIYSVKDLTGISSVAADKDNNDPYYYTIDGLRLAEPTHAGLYIHNGKKVYITK